MTDQTGRAILGDLNEVARTCNATYEGVNTRTASVEQVRARITTMREHLDRIETHLINDTVLASVVEEKS